MSSNSSAILSFNYSQGAWSWILSLFLITASALAQSQLEDVHVAPRQRVAAAESSSGSRSIHPVFRKTVDLVLVPVTVTDPMQRLVTGLQPDNFQIFENGKQEQIKHFSSEDAPVSLGIIVDISASMGDKIEAAREAVKELCDSANPQDEFFLVTFSDEPHLVHDFTDSPGEIEVNLAFAKPRGRTSLLDAIYLGTRKMREAKYGRKALVIISDGGDNHSRYTERDLKSVLKESDVAIYAIGLFDRYVATPEELLGPGLLSDIAETSGGRAFILEKLVEMPQLARRIGFELRTQYVLGYSPQSRPHDGKWHKIKIKLKLPKSLPYLQARAKTGYYASTE
ncbi:MAG: VWA domain-containing protein [Candidatus Sulfotelmatobacter sp.]